jgi:hypothetical protein
MMRDFRAQRPQSTEPLDASCAAAFKKLADRWREETGHLSSPVQIAMHPAYQEIMSWGERALPYIFEDLRTRGD